MGATNNHPTVSGDQRLKELREAGQFMDGGDYHSRSANEIYAIDSAYDALVIDKANNPSKYTPVTPPESRCGSCGTTDQKAFDEEDSNLCVSCEEVNADMKRENDADEADLDADEDDDSDGDDEDLSEDEED